MSEAICLRVETIRPFLRTINLLQCEPGFRTFQRRQYTHYLLYVHKGRGSYEINSIIYKAEPGDLFFLSPGTTNTMVADQEDPFLLSGIDFDFTQNHCDNPLAYPINTELFDPSLVPEYIEYTDFSGFPAKTNLGADMAIGLIHAMVEAYAAKRVFWQQYVDGLLQAFLVRVIQRLALAEYGAKGDVSCDHILRYLAANATRNVSAAEVAEFCHYHPVHINRMLLAYTGMTLKQYMLDLRIRTAIEMLRMTDKSIGQIAQETGFESLQYFSRLFKKKTGSKPSQLRQL